VGFLRSGRSLVASERFPFPILLSGLADCFSH